MAKSPDRLTAAVERLRAESQILEDILRDLPPKHWQSPTPAQGWTVAHQIAHLAWTDTAALASLDGEEAFGCIRTAGAENPVTFVHDAAEQGAQKQPSELFAQWRANHLKVAEALEQADHQARYPWFGPSMKALSLTTARIMETWAHGQDVAAAVGFSWPQTAALKDVAHLGLATRQFTYKNNGMEAPTSEMYVELNGPDGSTWTWGSPEAENSVKGSAWDFALLVTQRAELDDLDLTITGDEANTWASIAQAFAGPPKSVVRAQQAASVDGQNLD